MPLSAPVLAAAITAQIPAEVKAKYPDAKPTPFQQALAQACAQAFIQVMTTMAKGIGTVGPIAVAPGFGISGISPGTMVGTAKSSMESKTGHSGAALEVVLNGIMKPAAQHVSLATVTSVSGFGGQCIAIVGWTAPQLSEMILAAFPSEQQDRLRKSQAGKLLLDAISEGFTTGVQAGIPALIPFGTVPPPPGPTIASFS